MNYLDFEKDLEILDKNLEELKNPFNQEDGLSTIKNSQINEIENKIKYNESIIRHLFISVKEHLGEDSQLLMDSKNRKTETEEIENDKVEKKSEVIETTDNAEDEETNTKEELVEQKESTEAKLEEDKNE